MTINNEDNIFWGPKMYFWPIFLAYLYYRTIFSKKNPVHMTIFQKINKNTFWNTFDLIPFLYDKRIAIFFISFFFLI